MKNWKSLFLLCLLPVCIAGIVPVSANSAIKNWNGSTSGGVISADGNCPITVTKEELTFSPDKTFKADAGETGGYVEAAYTLYNPSDMDVSASLLFPYESPVCTSEDRDYSLTSVTAKGTTLESSVHYVYGSLDNFDVNQYLEGFSLDYLSNENYSKDSIIYTYELSFETSTDEICRIDCSGAKFGPDNSGLFDSPDQMSDGDTVSVSFLGSDMLERYLDNASFYTVNNKGGRKYVEGKLTTLESSQMTFYEYAMKGRYSDTKVSETDWFNACFTSYVYNSWDMSTKTYGDIYNHLIPSIYYTLDIKSKETVVNTVKAPLYPTIYANYSPYKFTYKYLLTPASTWSSFSDLTITIETDMVLSDAAMTFEKTEEGYVLHSDTLPSENLTFTLCESANPQKSGRSSGIIIMILIILAFLIPIGFGVGALFGVIFSDQRKIAPSKEKTIWKIDVAETAFILASVITVLLYISMWAFSSICDWILSVIIIGALLGFEITKMVLNGKVSFRSFVSLIIMVASIGICLAFSIFEDGFIFTFLLMLPTLLIWQLINVKINGSKIENHVPDVKTPENKEDSQETKE